MSGPLRWEVEGRHWPNRDTSRFVETRSIRWHVQRAGSGPVILLLHGTGASSHSWRDVLPSLADDFTVVAPDLPGHGFTTGRPPGGMTLTGMALAVRDLFETLGDTPQVIVGHSAGTAIALQLALETGWSIPIVGFNPAIMPFPGVAAHIFPTMAKLLFVNPFMPRIFARMAQVPGETERFLRRSTGSQIDREGLRLYETLFGNSRHCEGALAMMANWNLDALSRRLGSIENPVLLVHSRGDTTIRLAPVERSAAMLPDCRLEMPWELGHLAHEEDPATATALVCAFAREHGVTATKETAS